MRFKDKEEVYDSSEYFVVFNKERFSSVPKSWKDIIIFDIDGVLVDNNERLKASIEDIGLSPKDVIDKGELNFPSREDRRKFWSVFLSSKYLHLDKPRSVGIELLNERFNNGYFIIILSGRPERMKDDTINQLRDFGVNYDMLVMRKEGDFRKDYEFKRGFIKSLGGRISEIHDDSPTTCIEIGCMGYKKRVVDKVFVPSSSGHGGLIYNLYFYGTDVISYRVIRHVEDSWYDMPSSGVYIIGTKGEAFEHINAILVRDIDQRYNDVVKEVEDLGYPMEVRWMWFTDRANNRGELIRVLNDIDDSIEYLKWLEPSPYTSWDFEARVDYPSDKRHRDLDLSEIIEFKIDNVVWRIPDVSIPKPLAIALYHSQ